ncbi:hypothetical protein AVEN_159737-1 [Araneus ventricosus]|uniref:Uncharacterized protein n=1 Tax=Araneus ventricosus TaxID=182803 RepID=A0A4Y2VKK2_ARAVE|nr:hypothetical protein AVEN_224350-1 [Araneus ventricosus]GBO25873.1 hypothetical protein AVEN_159737-1 [Araneus ventricosus]
MTVTALSIALSSPDSHLALQTKLQVIPRSRFILQRVFLTRRDITWKSLEKSGSRLLIDISRKLSRFLKSSICRQICHQCRQKGQVRRKGQGSRPGRCLYSIIPL